MKKNELIKVLIVDDENQVRRSLAEYVKDCGYEVLEACDGIEGLEVFEKEKPDIVLTDLRMPRMSGFELVKIIAETDEEMPIVVISGTGVLKDSIEAIRVGAWDYIAKPIYDLDELDIIIKRCLDRAELIRINRHYREHLEDDVAKRTSELRAELVRRREAEKRIRDMLQELSETNIKLVTARDEAEHANNAKSEFLANMSHELKTPLNAILGFSNLLKESTLDLSQKKYVNTIIDSGQHLLTIIGDLLDISQIVSGEVVLNNKPFNLNIMLNRIINICPQLNANGVNFSSDVDRKNTSIFLEGDFGRISQIILSLLDNAFKFTRSGNVYLKAEVGECYHTIDNHNLCPIRIIVQDSGCGIPLGKQDKVFDSFYQADYSHTRMHEGVGIGLAVVKKLVEIMGGTVFVESEVDHGSRFTVELTLPRIYGDFDENQEYIDAGVVIRRFPQSMHLLLVEDNSINALMMCEALVKRGAMIDTAMNGQKAIEMLREQHYDAILMDVMMPVMGGLEATKIIRRDISSELPIIGVSAATLKDDVQKGIDAGMNDYITKPVDFDTLTDVISHCVCHSH